MSRTLYVHVGPRKTATTSIQHFLSRQDNSVVIYPKAGLHREGSHHNLVFKFFGEDHRCVGKSARCSTGQMLDKVADEAATSDRPVVISSEELASRDMGAFISAVLPRVRAEPSDVEVIVACREHFDRAASWYKMRLRVATNGEELYSPGEFLAARAGEVCYAPLIGRIRAAGFRVKALNYHPSSTWAARFLTYIGFDGRELPAEIGRRQVGPGMKALVATMATNKVVHSKMERRKYLRAFANMVESRKPPDFIFDRDSALKADRLFDEDRQFLMKEFGIRIDPPDIQNAENMLYIDEEEFADLIGLVQRVGESGGRIAEAARQYVRHGKWSEIGK